jgi:hypothetical protein
MIPVQTSIDGAPSMLAVVPVSGVFPPHFPAWLATFKAISSG